MLNEGMLILDELQMEDIVKKPVEDYYSVLSMLGKGKFGVVRKVVNKKTGITYAAKCIKKKRLSVNLLPSIHHEISVMKMCKSSGILGLHEVYETANNVTLILEYVAVLRYDPIIVKADVWSIGVLTYVLLSGFTPFGGDSKQETYLNISKGIIEFDKYLFDSVTLEAMSFIRSALILDPETRPSVDELLEHTWFFSSN